MNLLDLAVKIGVEDKATSKIESISKNAMGTLGGAAKALGKATLVGVGAATAGAVAMGKAVLDTYGDYEQLVGGIDKLYGKASEKLQNYADNAYKTSGMSANQYMETATQFSAALINSLGGDVNAAADMTDVAMRAISDNVDTFGSDMSSVTNAFQGFAKQNYTMLDNLKLGYGGTKQEMERLIDDANEYAESIGQASDLSIDSFADIVTAIELVQEKQKIAGTTAKEASTTIQGSVRMAKAAWENFLGAVGGGDTERMTDAMDGIVDAIFGPFDEQLKKRSGGIIANVLPVIQNTVSALGRQLPQLVGTLGATMMDAILASFGITPAATASMSLKAKQLTIVLQNKLEREFPKLLESGGRAVASFVQGIADHTGEVAGYATQIVTAFLEAIPAVLPGLAEAGLSIVEAVGDAIIDNAPKLVESLQTVIGELFGSISIGDEGESLGGVLNGIIDGLVQGTGERLDHLREIIADSVVPAFEYLSEAAGHFLVAIRPWMPALANVATYVAGAFLYAMKMFINVFASVVDVIAYALEWVMKFANWLPQAAASVASFVSNAGSYISALPGIFASWLGATISNVASWASSLWSRGRDAMAGFLGGITEKWGSVLAWFSGMPQRIMSAVGDTSRTLYNAGWRIINGFWDGLKSRWDSVTGWVTGIGKWIADNKGPKEYDLGLLVPNGTWIMEGLQKGLENGIPSLRSTLGEVTDMIGKTNAAIDYNETSYGAYGAESTQAPVNVYITLDYDAGTDATEMVYDIATGLKIALGGA